MLFKMHQTPHEPPLKLPQIILCLFLPYFPRWDQKYINPPFLLLTFKF